MCTAVVPVSFFYIFSSFSYLLDSLIPFYFLFCFWFFLLLYFICWCLSVYGGYNGSVWLMVIYVWMKVKWFCVMMLLMWWEVGDDVYFLSLLLCLRLVLLLLWDYGLEGKWWCLRDWGSESLRETLICSNFYALPPPFDSVFLLYL
jgi:hypothetical protein